MDLSVLLPSELLITAMPESRAAPPFQARAGTESDPASALLPFAFLLQQACATALPAGEALPATGNTLPPAAVSTGLPLELPPTLGARLDAGGAPLLAAPDGARRLGADAFGAPIEPSTDLDAARAAMFAELPGGTAAADDAPPSQDPAASVPRQLADAALDLDVPHIQPSAPPTPPGAELTKPSAAQAMAALAAAPAAAGGEPRAPLKAGPAQAPDIRNADGAPRALAPFELELDATTAPDGLAPPPVPEDAPLVSKAAERAPLPSLAPTDGVSSAPSAASHGLATSPSQPAAGTLAAPHAQPPAHPHGGVDTTAARSQIDVFA